MGGNSWTDTAPKYLGPYICNTSMDTRTVAENAVESKGKAKSKGKVKRNKKLYAKARNPLVRDHVKLQRGY